MTRFVIEYIDPETGLLEEKYAEFSDSPAQKEVGVITDQEWANDYGYSLADKGWYKATPLENKK